MTHAIGIDLGTTHSCVGVFKFGKVEIITNDQGYKTTPSCVAFNGREQLIGKPAKDQASQNPENTIYDMKRLIGRKYNDQTVQADIKNWPFKIISDHGLPKVMIQRNGLDVAVSPEEVSAMVLTKMKQTAEAYLETSVKKAVITVPAFFSDSQRKATLKAAKKAGLKVMRLINEPTAAAIAYAMIKEDVRGTILVYDLGGGTLDVSILTVTDTRYRVRATHGNTHLGGQDFTNNLLNYMIDVCKKKFRKDIRGNTRAVSRLMQQCEEAKNELSFAVQATITVDCLVDGINFCEKITRAKFDDINSNIFKTTLDSVAEAITSAQMTKEEIDKVIMVGGSSRIPKLQWLLEQFFNKRVYMSINPDEAIAYGASVISAVCDGVNIRDRSNLIIQDIIPMSLGIGTFEDFTVYSIVIPRNSTIPMSKVRRYETSKHNQTAVAIRVYEGEAPKTKDNIFIEKFTIYDIPPRPKGKEKVDVTFAIDINGVLKITAKNVSTGNKVSIVSVRKF